MKKKMLLWLIVLFVALCFGVFLFNWEVQIDTNKIPAKIEYGTKISKPTAYLKGKYFFKDGFEIEVVDKNENNFSETGTYVNFYEARFLFYSARVQKDISVIDTKPPKITLNYKKNHHTIPGESYVEEGYSAYDDYDGDLTDKVEKFVNNGVITYFVVDSSGNWASVDRDIYYDDVVAPEISLFGESEITLFMGTTYNEQGATAQDNCDGDLTSKIVISGVVDTAHIGTYILEYKVVDTFGNESKVSRTIHVLPTPDEPEQNPPDPLAPKDKVIYLTFDDGPSQHTLRLLDTLDKYNVKATFFVVHHGESKNEILREIVRRGHSIGIHSVTHDYKTIYESENAFLNDLYTMQSIIKQETGVETFLMRFPGGSSNSVSKKYCKGIMTILTQKVQELGFQYFDWNVSSGDAGGATTKEEVFNNVVSGVQNYKHSIVLQHDIKSFSVDAVEMIIEWGLENEYTFLPLDTASPTTHHKVFN